MSEVNDEIKDDYKIDPRLYEECNIEYKPRLKSAKSKGSSSGHEHRKIKAKMNLPFTGEGSS